ncbi:hypothetical protein C8J56DRAFT_801750, partial [Mycena floridula]
ENVAAHILHDDGFVAGSNTCGLCFANGCVWYIKTKRKVLTVLAIDAKLTTCPNFKKLSYKSAAGSIASSPSSNVPIKCPRCPANSPAVWKYNMPAHFQLEHSNAPRAALDAVYNLDDSEKEWMKDLWKKRPTKLKDTTAQKGSGKPLVISEAHRADMVLR